MPRLNISQLLAANTPVDVLANWQYQYIPMGGIVNLCLRSTTATTKYTFSSGSETLAESQPVPAGGVAGQTPTPFNSPPLTERVAAGDRLKLLLVDTAVATVDGFIDYQPG